jgi:hypothetical protein
MRKLAPTILAASIAALAGGAFANTGTMSTTDKVTGSPTVDTNTNNPQGMAYTDKSTTSPGTNAKIDETQPESGMPVAKVKKHKKLARNTTPATTPTPTPSTNNAPLDSTNGGTDKSTSGSSSGH